MTSNEIFVFSVPLTIFLLATVGQQMKPDRTMSLLRLGIIAVIEAMLLLVLIWTLTELLRDVRLGEFLVLPARFVMNVGLFRLIGVDMDRPTPAPQPVPDMGTALLGAFLNLLVGIAAFVLA